MWPRCCAFTLASREALPLRVDWVVDSRASGVGGSVGFRRLIPCICLSCPVCLILCRLFGKQPLLPHRYPTSSAMFQRHLWRLHSEPKGAALLYHLHGSLLWCPAIWPLCSVGRSTWRWSSLSGLISTELSLTAAPVPRPSHQRELVLFSAVSRVPPLPAPVPSSRRVAKE